MALDVVDFLVDGLTLGGEVRLNLTVSILGDDAIEPAYFGSVELGLELLSFVPLLVSDLG